VTPTLRRLFAFGAALLAVLAAVPEVVAHSHRSWEADLARQVTVRSAAPVPCAPTLHFDPAEIDVHPPCPGCLSRHAGLGVLADRAALGAEARFAALDPSAGRIPPALLPVSRARGRAPPSSFRSIA